MLKPLLLSLSLLSTQAFAAWQLNSDVSDLSFTSIKQNAVAENHHFTRLNAQLDEKGKLAMDIDLASIESLIPIRNQRMQDMLFSVKSFPKATLRADLSTQLKALKSGVQVVKGVPVSLTLHGQTKRLSLDLVVNKHAKQLHVSPLRPVLVRAEDYKMAQGVEALRKIAGLAHIATSVPVTFNLVFNAKP